MSDFHNPSAFRIYLYLLRQITGWEDRYSIEFRPKKMRSQINMGNSFYNAIRFLEDKNMIYYTDKDGVKYIGINAIPESWKTKDIDLINEKIETEIDYILERERGVIYSLSSSSWSSSSSSSMSYSSDDYDIEEEMLKELDHL
jgi:hypothetical protein